VYRLNPSSGLFAVENESSPVFAQANPQHNRSRSNMNNGPFVDHSISEKFHQVIQEKVKISELLETKRLCQKNLRSLNGSKESTKRDLNQENSQLSIKYESQSKRRERYVDNYFNMLNKMPDHMERVEQYEI
jgi:hypothetical protein